MSEQDKKLRLRFLTALGIVILAVAYLIAGLANLQLQDSDIHTEKAESTRTKTIYLRGKRGNIIDADSVILAEDQLIYNVTFYKDATQTSKATYAEFTRSILETIDIIEPGAEGFNFYGVDVRTPLTFRQVKQANPINEN